MMSKINNRINPYDSNNDSNKKIYSDKENRILI